MMRSADTRSLNIRTKLFVGYGCLVLLTAIVGGWGAWVFSRSSEAFQVTVQESLPAVDHLLQMDRDMNLAVLAERSAMFLKQDTAQAREQLKQHDAVLAQITDRWARYTAIPASDEERRLWPSFEAARQSWETVSRKAVKTIGRDFAQGNHEAIAITLGEGAQKLEKARDLLINLIELREEQAQEYAAAEQARAIHTRRGIIALVMIAFALAVATAVLLSRSIGRPLRETVDLLRTITDGDLTKRLVVRSHDEIGELTTRFNGFADKLTDIMSNVRFAATKLAGASKQLSAASMELASSTSQQAGGLKETAYSLEGITVSVKENADNAQQAATLATGSRDAAEGGGRVVSAAIASMNEITQASSRIVDIITVIDDIAFQTNILALNAAVEAARAGEQGRGFAVVAAEVRSLAQRSANAAQEIKVLINDTAAKVEEGTAHVHTSGKTLEEIVKFVKRVADIVGNIAGACQQQSTGIDHLNRAVSQMDNVTQNNATQSEKLSATSQSLAAQAEELQRLVEQFKLPSTDNASAPASSVQPTEPSEVEHLVRQPQRVNRGRR